MWVCVGVYECGCACVFACMWTWVWVWVCVPMYIGSGEDSVQLNSL